jgi:two-component system sensor histidine kinase PhoQ
MSQTGNTPSIHLRLLAASLVIMPLFLGITATILDRAFANYQSESQRESMRLQQLLLAKAADWDGAQWTFQDLDELRLNLLQSGLYAFVLSDAGEVLWQSTSAELMGEQDNPVQLVSQAALDLGLNATAIGDSRFDECVLNTIYFCYSTRIAWGSSGPENIFLIIESRDRVIAARSAYRNYLLWLSLATALLLLLAQSAIFRWGLAPLRKMATAIGLLERGESEQLDGRYPGELLPLTQNLNLLLANEKRRRKRVRNTMDRLTHVLKTPLMLIRNSTDEDREFRRLVQEQVSRMLEIVEAELAKARLDGRPAAILGKPVAVKPVLQRICDAYGRLPRGATQGDQQISIDTSAVQESAIFHGEERDLQDLFGSILENSLKYCKARIEIGAKQEFGDNAEMLVITIGDDGDGIPAGYEKEILRRGARADTANVGQGLGLSIVVEIVSAYGGSLHTDRSDLGGALFIVKLPAGSHS